MQNINIDPWEELHTINGIAINIRFEPAAISNRGMSIAVYAKVVDPKTIPDDKWESVKEGWNVIDQRNKEEAIEAITAVVEKGLESISLTE
jgi:hypothetical protein